MSTWPISLSLIAAKSRGLSKRRDTQLGQCEYMYMNIVFFLLVDPFCFQQ